MNYIALWIVVWLVGTGEPVLISALLGPGVECTRAAAAGVSKANAETFHQEYQDDFVFLCDPIMSRAVKPAAPVDPLVKTRDAT